MPLKNFLLQRTIIYFCIYFTIRVSEMGEREEVTVSCYTSRSVHILP